jgi:Ca2+/H+ antiporter, TMEM165/GDT1 family
MASLHKGYCKILTLALLAVIFLLQLVEVASDLAPNEEEFENAKSEDKKPETVTTLEPSKGGSNLGFIHAFIASFSVIIVSEIGDKTFFIAAIMSMVSEIYLFYNTQ